MSLCSKLLCDAQVSISVPLELKRNERIVKLQGEGNPLVADPRKLAEECG